ncbi:hypothetical protein [Evansella tamaricis]|uniref:Uncharacterized protein n=1 Tax=Evansella tamaricis TaxID=2069301 RepID=A0ABS6JJZ0_9BACI|nr:hypothetical protein [Evansella tamaricis]MBU9713976.1 hypothetical protein [Evansella tamaricis]
MSIKKSVAYFIYTFVLIVLFIFIGDIIMTIRQKMSTTGVAPLSVYFFSFMYVPIGITLGLPLFIQQYKKDGLWKVNKEKLVFAGVPILYLCFFYFLVVYAPSFLIPPGNIAHKFLNNGVEQFSGIVFGFIVITSIYKSRDNSKC